MDVQEIRQKFPEYQTLSDKELVDAIHAQHYSQLPIEEYYKRINFTPEPEEDIGFLSRVYREGKGSKEGAITGLGTTGEVILARRADTARKRGDTEKAEELMERARALRERMVEREEIIRDYSTFRSKYGDTGVDQLKNLTDPDWWAATIGRIVPGSLPYLTGAYTFGKAAAMSPIKNPYAILAASMVGGASAVYAQEFGNAYVTYLEKHPGDKEGALDYAKQKSAFGAIINAVALPAGRIGIGKSTLERALIQIAVQSNIGVTDVYVGNVLENQFVDPNKDTSEGLLDAAVGEAIFEGPATARIAYSQYKNSKQDLQKIQDEYFESLEKSFEERANSQIEEEFGNLNLRELKEMPVRNTEFEKVEIYPDDTRETVLKKFKEATVLRLKQEDADAKAFESVLSELTRPKILEGKIRELEETPKEQLFSNIVDMFGILDEETGQVDMDRTWEAYNFWADKQGYTPADHTRWVNPETDIADDIYHIANAATNSALRRNSPSAKALGKEDFDDYVEYIQTQFTPKQLKMLYQQYVPKDPGFLQSDVEKMAPSELAFALAEFAGILEQQQQKEAFVFEETKLPFKKVLSRIFPSVAEKPKVGAGVTLDVSENADSPRVRREIEPEGNAIFAEGEIVVEGKPKPQKIYFARETIGGQTFLENLKQQEAQLDETIRSRTIPESTLGSLVVVDTPSIAEMKDMKGVSLEQIENTEPNFSLTGITLPNNMLPQNQVDFYNRIIVGPWFKNMRPAGMTGLPVFEAIKKSEGRIRSLMREAEQLGYSINQAILAATRPEKGKERLTDLDARLALGRFIKQTNAYVKLTEEQKEGKRQEIKALEKDLTDTTMDSKTREERLTRKAGLEADLEGYVSTKLAIPQLPKELQNIARETRAKIDALSRRVLKESIGKKLSEEEIAQIEGAIGEYTTSILGFYETEFGFNPRFDKSARGTFFNFLAGDVTFKKRKMAKKLYNAAVESVIFTNMYPAQNPKYDPKRTDPRKTAEREVDRFLRQGGIETKAEVIELKETLRSTSDANKVHMEQGLKLRPRKYMPFPIRKLLGEVTEAEPDILVASSFARVAQLVERNRFFNELLEINTMPGEMFLSPVRNEAAGYTYRISDDPLNPLSGYFTTKTYAQALTTDSLSDNQVSDKIYKFYRNAVLLPKGLTQYGMVVISPGTQVRNFEGAFFMLMFTGNLFTLSKTGDVSAAARMAQSVLFPDFDYAPDGSLVGAGEKAQQIARIGREQGVMFTNSVTRDALGIFKEVGAGNFSSGDKVIHALYSMKHTPVGQFYKGTIGNIVKGLGATYNLVDDFFKMLDYAANITNIKNVLSELENQARAPIPDSAKLALLRDFSKTLTTKAGTYKSDAAVLFQNIENLDEYVYHLASWMTRNTIPNYDFVGRFAQFVRQIPTGNFIAFPTEIARTSVNNAQLAYKLGVYKIPQEIAQDMGIPRREITLNKNEDGTTIEEYATKRPFKGMALKRTVGAGLAAYVIPKGLQAFAQLYFGVDDDELEALDEVVPDYEKYGLKIPMSEIGEDGKMEYSNTTYTFPYADAAASIEAVKKKAESELEIGAELPEAVAKGIWEGFSRYMKSYYGISIAPRTMAELALNRDLDTNKPIWIETDSWGDKMKPAIDHVLKTSGPGGYRQMQKVVNSFAIGDKKFDRYGNVQSKAAAFSGLMGVTIGGIDPTEDIGFSINTVKTGFDAGVIANMNEFKYEQDAKTAEEVLEQWDDAQRAWYKIQQDLYIKYVAYEAFGGEVFAKAAKKQLKERAPAGVKGQKFSKNLAKGIFTPWEMPDSYKDNYLKIKRELGLQRTWPKQELRTRYRYLKDQDISLMSSPRLQVPWE